MSEVLKKYKLSADKVLLSSGKLREAKKKNDIPENQEKSLVLDKIIQSRVDYLEEKIQLEKEQAYRSGFEDGKEMVISEEREKLNKNIELFSNLIEELKKQKDELLSSADKELLKLSLEIASKVIRQKIKCDQKFVLRNLKNALRLLSNKSRIVIRLNSADLEIISKFLKDYKSTEDLKEVLLEEDNSITRGGCLVQSELSCIDAQIETQLEIISKALSR